MTTYAYYGDHQTIKDFCMDIFAPNDISLRYYGRSTKPVTYVVSASDTVIKVLSEQFELIPKEISFADQLTGWTEGTGPQQHFE